MNIILKNCNLQTFLRGKILYSYIDNWHLFFIDNQVPKMSINHIPNKQSKNLHIQGVPKNVPWQEAGYELRVQT